MMVAVREGYDYAGTVKQGARIRVATKYVNAARDHFATKGVHIDLIKLYGSMELAPLVGLSDVIVDLVSTGGTLKANGLVAVEHISDISSRLVVNQAALKLKRSLIQPVIDAFATAVGPRAVGVSAAHLFGKAEKSMSLTDDQTQAMALMALALLYAYQRPLEVGTETGLIGSAGLLAFS